MDVHVNTQIKHPLRRQRPPAPAMGSTNAQGKAYACGLALSAPFSSLLLLVRGVACWG